MLLNSWSIALLICTGGVIFLVSLAATSAVRILLFWDAGSDSELQIELEGQTWLSAALLQSALAVQVLSLLLLVLAADAFSDMIAGAMCATGSFLANDYGVKVLFAKIAGIFLYGFWIVLHRLDLQSEYYPLVRLKYLYLLFILPLLFLDSYWLFSYLANLQPDIITSCCGIIFSNRTETGNFLLLTYSVLKLAALFYLVAAFLFAAGYALIKLIAKENKLKSTLLFFYGIAWSVFFLLSLLAVTTFFSSYIYAMPYHNCPFDILQKEYNYIGYPLYFTLFAASFLGMSASAIEPFRKRPGLLLPVRAYQKTTAKISLLFLLLFLVCVTYPVIRYVFAGGEI